MMTQWEWMTIVSRWLLYIGMSVAIGGAASLWLLRSHPSLHASLRHYTLGGAGLGLASLTLHFLILAGALAEQGVAGMFDPWMLELLWYSGVGDASVWRAVGFGLLMVSLLAGMLSEKSRLHLLLEVALALIGVLLVAGSYTLSGHVSGRDWFAAALLVVHILLTAWWMGSLYPLWLAGHRLAPAQAHHVMERFGGLAVLAVLVLLAAGVSLSYLLTGWSNLLGSDYGFWLLLKVGLVMLILLLAACHRWILVPALAHARDGATLKRSLLIEKLLGASILAITTVLTTLVGPVH